MNERSGTLFRWLWRDYLRPHRVTLGFAIILMMIEGSMLGLLSRMIQPMFDTVFLAGDQDALWWVGLGILAIFCTRAISSAGQRILLMRVNQNAAADMRNVMLRHLMRLDSGYHQVNPPGALIERVQGDVTLINTTWASLLTAVGRDLIAVVVLFSVALWVDWRWTAVALIGIPFMVLPSLLAQAYVRRRSAIARDLAGRMSTRLDEVFHGINPIKLNALEAYQATRYDTLSQQRVTSEVKAATGQATVPALVDIMSGVGFLGVMIYGGGEIIDGTKTVGQFMSFFTAISLAFEPLRRLGMMSGKWQIAAASMGRVRSVLAVEPTLTSPASPLPAPSQAPDIRFDDVHLTYGELPVLNGTTFTAAAGKTTALVGASGAGKSTIFNVLTRLVDPAKGTVQIADTNVRDMDLAGLRALFSVVAQDAALFDDSLRDNILLGRDDVRDDALRDVLDAAHVSDFLGQLEAGLDSPAGPRGSNLSGGQRQRVAIARALLRNTPILLLDEATSALDTKSEAIVQAALERLSAGRTTLVIAHRLSTVRNADKIVVMDKGRVVDEGTHDTLIAREGLYADLHRLQFSERAQDV